MRGDLLALGDHLVHGLDHGGPADRQAAAAVGAHAEWDLCRVAVHDLDLVERHTQLINDELGESGFMALAMAVRASEHGDAAGGVDADLGNLIQAGPGAE